jgi:hypothetical protein
MCVEGQQTQQCLLNEHDHVRFENKKNIKPAKNPGQQGPLGSALEMLIFNKYSI